MLRDEITIESYEDAEDIHDAEPAAAVPGSAPAAAANPASDTVIGGASSHLGYSRRGWLMFSAMVLGILMAIAVTAYFSGSGARQESYLGKSGNCKVFMSLPDASATVNASLNRDILAYAAHQTGECSGDEFCWWCAAIRSGLTFPVFPAYSCCAARSCVNIKWRSVQAWKATMLNLLIDH